MAVLSFNELGVSLAIVRWDDDPERIAPTVNTISVGMSLVLTLAMVLAAPVFAGSMGDPGATGLVQLLALCVLVNGVVATPAAVMQRHFRQDQRMVADQVNVWVGAFVSIGLAVAGAGASALVVGRLTGAVLSALLFLHYLPIPYRFGWSPPQARRLLAFGSRSPGRASSCSWWVSWTSSSWDTRWVRPTSAPTSSRPTSRGGPSRSSPDRCATWRPRSSPACGTAVRTSGPRSVPSSACSWPCTAGLLRAGGRQSPARRDRLRRSVGGRGPRARRARRGGRGSDHVRVRLRPAGRPGPLLRHPPAPGGLGRRPRSRPGARCPPRRDTRRSTRDLGRRGAREPPDVPGQVRAAGIGVPGWCEPPSCPWPSARWPRS